MLGMAFTKGGSWFAVMAEDRDETPTERRVLSILSQLTKPPKNPVWAEISNREYSKKKQVSFTASKYMVSTGTNKGHLNRLLKENLSGVYEGTISKNTNKGK